MSEQERILKQLRRLAVCRECGIPHAKLSHEDYIARAQAARRRYLKQDEGRRR